MDKNNKLNIVLPPPGSTPICNLKTGMLNNDWKNWLDNLYKRVGSANSSSNSLIDLSIEEINKKLEEIIAFEKELALSITNLEINDKEKTILINELYAITENYINELLQVEYDVEQLKIKTNLIDNKVNQLRVDFDNLQFLSTSTSVGSGISLIKEIVDNNLKLKSIKAGNNITIDNTTNPDEIVVKTKGILAGSNVIVDTTTDPNNYIISASGGGGGGGGGSLVVQKDGNNLSLSVDTINFKSYNINNVLVSGNTLILDDIYNYDNLLSGVRFRTGSNVLSPIGIVNPNTTTATFNSITRSTGFGGLGTQDDYMNLYRIRMTTNNTSAGFRRCAISYSQAGMPKSIKTRSVYKGTFCADLLATNTDFINNQTAFFGLTNVIYNYAEGTSFFSLINTDGYFYNNTRIVGVCYLFDEPNIKIVHSTADNILSYIDTGFEKPTSTNLEVYEFLVDTEYNTSMIDYKVTVYIKKLSNGQVFSSRVPYIVNSNYTLFFAQSEIGNPAMGTSIQLGNQYLYYKVGK